jgi:glucose-6-phosphate isomerase
MIENTGVYFNSVTGRLSSPTGEVTKLTRYLKDTISIYANQNVSDEELSRIAYEVELHNPENGVEGALQFGTSYLYPGKVNDEFFITKGHTHAIENRAEYYFCIDGEGLLLLMDGNRNVKVQKVEKGSLHYIPGYVAHRLVNTGKNIMTVGACWNADAGHNYGDISTDGFSVRVFEKNGKIEIVEN